MANKKIAGITVEIGGDTSKLSKALGDVDKKSKDLKAELKEVNNALKLDPKNVELLHQKQQILAESIENSRKKLERLKEVQEQVTAQYERGEIDAGQFRAFQREIEITSAELQQFEEEARRSEESASNLGNKLKNTGEDFKNAGEKVEKAGEAVTQFGDDITKAGEKASIASGIIVGAAAASYAAWQKTDKGYDTIIKKTGATGEALDELKAIADDVYTSLPVEMDKVGTAVGEINTRFGSTGDELEALTSKFIKYSEINDSDVNTSVDNISASMRAFGLKADSAGDVLDKITSISQRTGISTSKLESLLVSQSATFKEMGLDIGEAAELLGQFEINGVDTATAMAALKKSQQNAAKSGKTLSESLEDSMAAIKNAKSDTEALSLATELFGAKGAAAMSQAIREDRVALGELDGSMKETAGIVEQTFEATQDAPQELIVALNSVKLEASKLAALIMQKLAPKIKQLTTFIKELTARFNNLSEEQKEMVLRIAAIVAAIGPALIVIGKVTSGIGSIISVTGKLMQSFGSLTSLIATNPAALVVAGIAAVVAAGVILYQKSEDFRELVNYLAADIASFAQVVIADLKDMWRDLKPIFKNIWTIIQDLIDILEGPLSLALIAIEKAFKVAWTAIKIVWDAVIPYFKVIVDGITKVFSVVKGVLTGDFQGAWDGIKGVFSSSKQFFQQIWDGIKEVFSTVGKFFKDTFSAAWSGVKDVFSKGGKAFEGISEGIFNAFKKIVDSLIDGINEVVSIPFDGINAVLKKLKGIKIAGYKPFKWVPTIDIPSIPHLPALAKGGELEEGQAIVAEAGPELIQMLNGKARVTPLTQSARNNALSRTQESAQHTTVHQTYNIYVKEFASPQDARTTSQELAKLQKQTNFGRGLAY